MVACRDTAWGFFVETNKIIAAWCGREVQSKINMHAEGQRIYLPAVYSPKLPGNGIVRTAERVLYHTCGATKCSLAINKLFKMKLVPAIFSKSEGSVLLIITQINADIKRIGD